MQCQFDEYVYVGVVKTPADSEPAGFRGDEMRNIVLTESEASNLWLTLTALISEGAKQQSYIGNRNNPEWKRSVYFSDSRAKVLQKIVRQLPVTVGP